MARPRNLLASLLLLVGVLAGAEAIADAGRIVALTGSLLAVKPDGRKRVLGVDSAVDAGDNLVTFSESRATVRFNDGGTVTLLPDSQFHIQEYAFRESDAREDKAVFALIKGGLRALTGLLGKRNADAYRMQTPTATIGIRGTDYSLLYCAGGDCAGKTDTEGAPLAEGLHIEVHEGRIYVVNSAGLVELDAGRFGFVKDRHTAPAAGTSGYHQPETTAGAGTCTAR